MAVTRQVTLPNGETATVRELTVAEVRDWVTDSAAAGARDPIHALALDGLGLDELARMVSCTAADLEAFAPSELAELLETAKALNPHFFRLRSALEWATGRVVRSAPPETSIATFAGSSPITDMPTS